MDTDPKWDTIDLIYALDKLGLSQVTLARKLGVNTTTINNVIHGRTTSRRIAEFIALQLNTSIEQLWPERYLSAAPEKPSAIQTRQEIGEQR
jgi:lambda repressor-like predicted transcriptional regulator